MNNKVYILLIWVLVVQLFAVPVLAADSKATKEYKIKAAFLYNFLLFTEWPEVKSGKPKKSIVIGIIGKDLFKDSFKEVEGKSIKKRKLIIKRFKSDVSAESLKECDLLFISPSLKKNVADILKSLEKQPVLTVSEMNGFIKSGGMINLLKKKDIIKFEINNFAAKSVGIKFHSKLLRVVVRVVEKGNDKKNK